MPNRSNKIIPVYATIEKKNRNEEYGRRAVLYSPGEINLILGNVTSVRARDNSIDFWTINQGIYPLNLQLSSIIESFEGKKEIDVEISFDPKYNPVGITANRNTDGRFISMKVIKLGNDLERMIKKKRTVFVDTSARISYQ